MSLSADIKYKSNFQQGAVKAKRRNKWVCALKQAMAEVGVYGPGGNPNDKKGPTQYTEVPWEDVKRANEAKRARPLSQAPSGGWKLSDKDTLLRGSADNIFDDPNELSMPEPTASAAADYATSGSMPHAMPMPSQALSYAPESFELSQRP